MIIFDGKSKAEKILLDLKEKIKMEKLRPRLAVISLGSNSSSKLFIKNKIKSAGKIGIEILEYKFSAGKKELAIIKRIKEMNGDADIDGIIVQLPLPRKFNTDRVVNSIDPKKDVDALHRINRQGLKKGKAFFTPPFPRAIYEAALASGLDLKMKKIAALVNSDIFGRILKIFFEKEGIKINYLLKGKKISKLKSADMVITALGRPNFIKAKTIKQGIALIDAGIVVKRGKILGDASREAAEKTSFFTPAPGGIGPLTVALLLKNVYLSARNRQNY